MIALFAINLDEYFIYKENVPISLMPFTQPGGMLDNFRKKPISLEHI